jgi:hypothetical protein
MIALQSYDKLSVPFNARAKSVASQCQTGLVRTVHQGLGPWRNGGAQAARRHRGRPAAKA